MSRTILRMFCASLALAFVPGIAAPAMAQAQVAPSAVAVDTSAVDAFYRSNGNRLLWLTDDGRDATATFVSLLQRADLDGFAAGPMLAEMASARIGHALASDDEAELLSTDKLLSLALVQYVQALRKPVPGLTYADASVRPNPPRAELVLANAAAAGSLSAHVRSLATPNPLYAELRSAALAETSRAGGLDNRILANLSRARALPGRGRAIVVDAASARLLMLQDGQVVDSMRVVVGKPATPTPMLASKIYYATLNPYWNVPQDLVRSLIAKNVLAQGTGYLAAHHYELLSDFSENPERLDPKDVDWHAVAAGTQKIRVRQLPGPGNSMGSVKFGFPNDSGVFLHDTPNKSLFAQDDRDLSNGCVRLEDAERLGRWLMGREPVSASDAPEQHVLLPAAVPVYITYLTVQPDNGSLAFVEDVYGLDRAGSGAVVAAR